MAVAAAAAEEAEVVGEAAVEDLVEVAVVAGLVAAEAVLFHPPVAVES